MQIVDPNSPPKAQRTLVDAEVRRPSEEEWPILRPEDIQPPKKPVPPINETHAQQQRSVSEGAAPRQITDPFFASRKLKTTSITSSREEPNENQTSAFDVSPHNQKLTRINETRPFNFKESCASNFHAISTSTESAMASPLAHKTSAPDIVSVPPRISSKRNSLLLSNQTVSNSPTPSPSVQVPQGKSSVTKWPLLENQEAEQLRTAGASLMKEKTSLAITAEHQVQEIHNRTNRNSLRTDLEYTAQSQHSSVRPNSSWSAAARSSPKDEPHSEHDGSTRIKRLSWRSNSSGSGPVLTIFGDADAVLLGQEGSIPDIPLLPDEVPEKTSQERALSGLAGRIFKQSSSTPNSVERGMSAAPPVKINPIRSMQPPRTVSSEISALIPSTLVSSTSVHTNKLAPRSTSTSQPRLDFSQNTTTVTPEPLSTDIASSSEQFNLSPRIVKVSIV